MAPRSRPAQLHQVPEGTWRLVLRWSVWLMALRLVEGLLIAVSQASQGSDGLSYEAWSRRFMRSEAHATLCLGLLLPALGWASQRFRIERGRLATSLGGHLLCLLAFVPLFRFLEIHAGLLLRWKGPSDWLAFLNMGFARQPSYWLTMLVALGLQYFQFQVLFHLLFTRWSLYENLRQASRLEALLARAEVRTLRNRLRAPFLFQLFGALPDLIASAPAEAQRLVGLLGEMLRRSLRDADEAEAPLSQELDLLQTYLRIEQVLDGEGLEARVDPGEGTAGALLPRQLLLPLAEEALGRRPRPLRFRLAASREEGLLSILMVDDASGPDRLEAPALREAADRLARSLGRAATLRRSLDPHGEVRTELRLPLRFASATPAGSLP